MIHKLKVFAVMVTVFHLPLLLLAPLAGATIRIMPLGDSITQGFASGEPDLDRQISYRKALFDRLAAAGYDLDFVGSLNNGSDIFGDADLADHEGHPGTPDDEVADQVFDWLFANPAEIVLLHIGTINPDPSPNDVDDILDNIDLYSPDVWVILALIINRSCLAGAPDFVDCLDKSSTTTNFNDNIEAMAQQRITNLGDKIIIVDMENGAGVNYDRVSDSPPGDMWDDIHPFETGYEQMADAWWFSGLSQILPVADAGPDQNVEEFDLVTLDGSASDEPKGGTLSFQWLQTVGTGVTLSDDTAEKPTFTAPDVQPGGQILTFQLTVTDGDGFEHTDTDGVDIDVDNPTSSSSGGGGGGGCFIATAADSSQVEPHVKAELRKSRGQFLLTNAVGKAFVDFYYSYSPPIADFIAQHDSLRAMVRWILLPLVAMSWFALRLGPEAILGLIVLTTFAIFPSLLFFLRRRSA